MPDPDLLRLYAKLAGYPSVNAFTQSAFDALANQWRNHPEVQALLHKKAGQKPETAISFADRKLESGFKELPRAHNDSGEWISADRDRA